MVAIKYERSGDFLDGTLDSPQEKYHMSRRTLRSQQKHKNVPCTKNEPKTRPNSPAQAQEKSGIHHHILEVV